MLPDAVFLGFLNIGSPNSSLFLLSCLKESFSIIISPLISNFFKNELSTFNGTDLMVFILLVILSP